MPNDGGGNMGEHLMLTGTKETISQSFQKVLNKYLRS